MCLCGVQCVQHIVCTLNFLLKSFNTCSCEHIHPVSIPCNGNFYGVRWCIRLNFRSDWFRIFNQRVRKYRVNGYRNRFLISTIHNRRCNIRCGLVACCIHFIKGSSHLIDFIPCTLQTACVNVCVHALLHILNGCNHHVYGIDNSIHNT